MGLIFWMSGDMFSSENTSSLVESMLYSVFPGISEKTVDVIHGAVRKLGHLGEYFVLGLLVFRAFRNGNPKGWNWRWASFSLAFVIFYAASDELHQSFTLTRSASVTDVGIDTVGGIISQIATALTCRLRRTI